MNIAAHVSVDKLEVGVLPRQKVRGWPKFDDGARAEYGALATALTQEFECDAHLVTYSCPNWVRRLDVGALDPEYIKTLGGTIPMVLAGFDVDCAESHRAGGSTDPCPAPDVWWIDELEKINRLLLVHPDGYFYRTRGGYRIIYVLPYPFPLKQPSDALEWSKTYCAWLVYLERVFDIHGDPCKDWQRLFRLPHATRDGEKTPERREKLGDPENVGLWDPVLQQSDRDEGARMSKKKVHRTRAEDVTADPRCDGQGVLFHALSKRGAIRHEIEPGKWAIDCPKMEEHSTAGQTDTVLWAPLVGDTLGWIHCSHSGCGHASYTLRRWIECFTKEELSIATVTAKVVVEPLRPTIDTTSELHRTVTRASKALANNPKMFARGLELVRVAGLDVSPHTVHSLRVELSRAAFWIGETLAGNIRDLPAPPDSVVYGIRDATSWEGVRELEGVINAPTLRPDGSLFDALGYDAETKLLRIEGMDIDPIPDAPTQDDAKKALKELQYLFVDYPFVKNNEIEEAARAVPIAAILTIIGRSAIVGATPCFVFDAPTAGSGKTMLADIISIVATGKNDAPKTSYTSREHELEKSLDDHARKGSRLLLLDNIATPFGGEALDVRLTTIDTVSFRVLGTPKTLEVPWRTVVLASGNNIQIMDDTIRRCLIGRIESLLARPETRTDFQEKELVEYVRKERARLYRAALIVLRAWFVAGQVGRSLFTWGSFNPWAKVVAGAIWFAGGGNVLNARGATVGHEVEGSDLLLEFMKLLNKTGPMSVKEILSQPALCSPLRELTGLKPGESITNRKISKLLARSKGRNICDLKLKCDLDTVKNVQVWSSLTIQKGE